MITVNLFVLTLLFIWLFIEFRKEKRRNRILQSFVAGVIKSISDYVSNTDMLDITSAHDLPPFLRNENNFPIPYKDILTNINHEFAKDFWTHPYWKWIKKDRNLFYEGKYANDGFNMIYWDFFDQAAAKIKKELEEAQK